MRCSLLRSPWLTGCTEPHFYLQSSTHCHAITWQWHIPSKQPPCGTPQVRLFCVQLTLFVVLIVCCRVEVIAFMIKFVMTTASTLVYNLK
jgi:hypothetical protein